MIQPITIKDCTFPSDSASNSALLYHLRRNTMEEFVYIRDHQCTHLTPRAGSDGVTLLYFKHKPDYILNLESQEAVILKTSDIAKAMSPVSFTGL